MSRKFGLVVITITLILCGMIGFAKTVEAANALPPGYLVGDDTGLQVGTDGQYFIRHDDIKPGLTFDRTITISNYSNEEGSFEIKFVMNPEDVDHQPTKSGEVDLLTAVTVTLTYQGKQIYTGPIDGSGTPVANKKSNPITLGAFETGEVRTMKATFQVSDAYPKSAWKKANSADFYWLFYASRQKTDPSSTEDSSSTSDSTTDSETTDSKATTDSETTSTADSNTTDITGTTSTTSTSSSSGGILGKLPQTGEDWLNVMLGAVVGGIIVCAVLIIAKKRKEDK